MSIVGLTPEELRQFIQQHHERTYSLIDVRQPGEYEYGHIPGALLMPLPKLVQSMENLPRDRELIFYCQNGGRSLAAAAMVEDEAVVSGTLHNLTGGVMAWDGAMTPEYPRIRIFQASGTLDEKLETAMNLEKGALNFYSFVSDRHAAQPWAEVFAKLAQAEIAHARMVYNFRQRGKKTTGDSFEDCFAGLSGDILEGGMTLQGAVGKAVEAKGRICLKLIDLALQIEYAAFDLYRTMAGQAADSDSHEAFIAIAQAEKAHMRELVKAIGSCPH